MFFFLIEIPKLQDVLQSLNNISHSEALNYMSGAYGILSLIEGTRFSGVVRSSNETCVIVLNPPHWHLYSQKTTLTSNRYMLKCSLNMENLNHFF